MKTAALTGIRQIELIEKAKPQLKNANDVLIKIKSVGICGSDIHYFNEGKIGSQVVNFPFSIGHEAAGIVEKVGQDVTNLKPGDRIAIEPTIWCGTCEQCMKNRKHTCLNQRFLGCPGQIEGCFSEYYILPERCCYKIAPDMPFELGVLAEPLSIGLYAMELFGKLKANSKIGILGAGPIGQCILSACTKNGYLSTFVTDKINNRLDLAKSLCNPWIGNPDHQDIVRDILEIIPNSLDVIFECCGKQEAIDQAINLLKPGGTLMMIGIPESDDITLKIDLMRRKEICFQNVRRQNECFQKAIDLIESDRSFFAKLISHKLPISEVSKGFEMVSSYQDNVMKVIIES